ncbi:MAG: hypothetical protein L0H75_07555 [Nitrosospira sp.]|nr:hypothetical protein [Nitrosospira sp.]
MHRSGLVRLVWSRLKVAERPCVVPREHGALDWPMELGREERKQVGTEAIRRFITALPLRHIEAQRSGHGVVLLGHLNCSTVNFNRDM